MSRFGSTFPDGAGLAAVLAMQMILAKKARTPRVLSPAQIAAREIRTEREQWNAAVDQRKADKRVAKGKV